MMEPTPNVSAWLKELAKRADENRVALSGLSPRAQMAEIERQALFGEIVICVWADAARPSGIDLQVIRGLELMRQAAGGKTPQEFITAVIPCVDMEQSIALERHLRKKYGWKRQLHRPRRR